MSVTILQLCLILLFTLTLVGSLLLTKTEFNSAIIMVPSKFIVVWYTVHGKTGPYRRAFHLQGTIRKHKMNLVMHVEELSCCCS